MASTISIALSVLIVFPALISAQGQAYWDYLKLWMPTECVQGGQEYQENETWEVGVVRYQCLNRKRVPVGCQIGQRWYNKGEGALTSTGHYYRTCELDNEGYMRVVTSQCAYNGQRYNEGETWNSDDNKFWFRCTRYDPLTVQIVVGGCVTDAGERLDVGERHTVGETWYLCEKKPTDAIAFCTQGCVANGQYYNIGQTWTGYDNQEYRCDKDNLRCKITLITPTNGYQEQTYLNNNDEYYPPTNNVYDPPASSSSRCEYRQDGVVRFYLPSNSYTYSPYNYELFIVCRQNDYEAREEYANSNPDLTNLVYAEPEYV